MWIPSLTHLHDELRLANDEWNHISSFPYYAYMEAYWAHYIHGDAVLAYDSRKDDKLKAVRDILTGISIEAAALKRGFCRFRPGTVGFQDVDSPV